MNINHCLSFFDNIVNIVLELLVAINHTHLKWLLTFVADILVYACMLLHECVFIYDCLTSSFSSGEGIISGAQRIQDPEFLIKRAEACGIEVKTVAFKSIIVLLFKNFFWEYLWSLTGIDTCKRLHSVQYFIVHGLI